MVNKWLNKVLNRVFPSICSVCGNKGNEDWDICNACYQECLHQTQRCVQCALPLPSKHQNVERCGQCITNQPYYDFCFSLGPYQPPLSWLLIELKFNQRLRVARLLGELMARHLQYKRNDRPQMIIPVPLHRARLRERGFNQSLELARPIAKQLGIGVNTNWFERSKATQEQTQLNAKQRSLNMRNAFQCRTTTSFNTSVPQHIAIIDDVMTTGATVNELARAARKSGVKRIDVWVCARADRPF